MEANPDSGPTQQASPPPSPPPPRGPRLWIVGVVVLVALLALLIGVFMAGPIGSGVGRVTPLVADEAHDHAVDADGYWTCGMHPQVILPGPGDCPICHMELTPLDPGKLTSEINIDPRITQNIGVRIAPVVEGPLVQEVRTVGSVTYDEAAVRVINTKIGGWVEELFVDQEGATVEPGQPLFSIYSPELYAAQEEYLLAHRGLGRIDAEMLPEAAAGAKRLLEAARTRLAFFDITPEQIAELEKTGAPRKTLTIHSPHRGVVIEKVVNEGVRIEPGMPVYRVADLSRVWVIVTLYEHQLPYVKVGQKATMSPQYLPGRTVEGEVAYIYPYLDAAARQVRVRLEFPNPDGQLKPGMFAEVELHSTLDKDATLAPREAIIATGERNVAFVSLGQGRFEPRVVKLGVETTGSRVQVLEGLRPGEQVVTSGQFLLDSESKMRSALAKLVAGDMASEQAPVVPDMAQPTHDEHASPAAQPQIGALDADAQATVDALVRAYLAVSDQLAADEVAHVQHHSAALRDAAAALADQKGPIGEAAAAVRDAADLPRDDIAAAREAFGPLSAAVITLAQLAPPTDDVAPVLYAANCPMAKADWLQPEAEIVNPYMGAKMLRCGSITGKIDTR